VLARADSRFRSWVTAAICQRAHRADRAHGLSLRGPVDSHRARGEQAPDGWTGQLLLRGAAPPVTNAPVLEIRPSFVWRRALVIWGAMWGAGMLAVAIVFLVSGPAIAAVEPLLLGAFGVIFYLRWAKVAVIVDATGMSVTNIDGFDRVPRSDIKAFRSRWIGPYASVVVVVRDGPFCKLDATVRVNPFRAG
jgi:hypothetical protein